jgi:hypothetical protein
MEERNHSPALSSMDIHAYTSAYTNGELSAGAKPFIPTTTPEKLAAPQPQQRPETMHLTSPLSRPNSAPLDEPGGLPLWGRVSRSSSDDGGGGKAADAPPAEATWGGLSIGSLAPTSGVGVGVGVPSSGIWGSSLLPPSEVDSSLKLPSALSPFLQGGDAGGKGGGGGMMPLSLDPLKIGVGGSAWGSGLGLNDSAALDLDVDAITSEIQGSLFSDEADLAPPGGNALGGSHSSVATSSLFGGGLGSAFSSESRLGGFLSGSAFGSAIDSAFSLQSNLHFQDDATSRRKANS